MIWMTEEKKPKEKIFIQKQRKNDQGEDLETDRPDKKGQRENWDKIQENKKWENRYGWRFHTYLQK